MIDKHAPCRFLSILLIVASVLLTPLSYTAVHAAEASGQPDVVVRISRINEVLSIVDELASSMPGQMNQPPSAMIGGMLMGTDWIDTGRSVAIGANFRADAENETPEMAALIPFSKPNDNFKAAYNAIQGTDYYLIPLPPGKATAVPAVLEAGLVESSRRSTERFVSADIAIRQLLKKANPQIQQLLTGMEEKLSEESQAMPEDVTVDDAKIIIDDLLDFGRQMETLSIGLDVTRSDLSFFLGLLAAPDSEMAALMTGEETPYPATLGAFEPAVDLQMRFRSRPFDIGAATTFIQKYFGEIYAAMGVDLESGLQLFAQFTGENVGAMAFDQKDVEMEMVAALKPDKERSGDFLETAYMPWLLDTGKEMAQFYNAQYPDLKLDSIFVRTDNTEIAGNKIIGVNGKMPVLNTESADVKLLSVNMRMTIVDDYLLLASDDVRMASLINQMSALEPKDPGEGPLMQMTMNLGELMKSGLALAPQSADAAQIPELGDLTYSVDVKDRLMTAQYGLKLSDIKALGSYMAAFIADSGKPDAPVTTDEGSMRYEAEADNRPSASAQTPVEPQQLTEDDALYWIDKGGLYAAYGNSQAAVKNFRKALELDPQNADAHFNLGLALAEMDKYDKAIEAVTEAISLSPENGRYIYGRGWIRLRAGNSREAMEDIRFAAQLGNADAIRYLEAIAPRRNP